MNYAELLKKRRAIRSFEDRKVSTKIIHEILQDACLAPSACNVQPWRFIVIQDRGLMQRISDESKRCLLEEIERNPDSPFARFKERLSDSGYNVFYNAPTLILVVGEDNYPWFYEDCTSAVDYLMFAATARGLGTCWIGLGQHIENAELRKEIGLPADYQITAAVILGYPTSIPEAPKRSAPIVLKSIEG